MGDDEIRLFVGGLPDGCGEADLLELFEGAEPVEAFVCRQKQPPCEWDGAWLGMAWHLGMACVVWMMDNGKGSLSHHHAFNLPTLVVLPTTTKHRRLRDDQALGQEPGGGREARR